MDPIRTIMTLVDEHKTSLPESAYLEICDNLKRLYASGDTVRDNYILNLTNDYLILICLLYTSPSPRDATLSRMPSSA